MENDPDGRDQPFFLRSVGIEGRLKQGKSSCGLPIKGPELIIASPPVGALYCKNLDGLRDADLRRTLTRLLLFVNSRLEKRILSEIPRESAAFQFRPWGQNEVAHET